MKQRPRIYYTETQKALMWEHWRKGESLRQIARLFDRNHSSVQGIVAETGGIRPGQRSRSDLALKLAEREEISRCSGRSLNALDCSITWARTFHCQPRNRTQRRATMLSSQSG